MGRLGVITEVEMVIMPQDMVEREVTTTDFSEFVAAMRVLQEDYNAALSGTGSKSVAEVLAEYEGTQASLSLTPLMYGPFFWLLYKKERRYKGQKR